MPLEVDEKMWETGALGQDDPETLQQMVWYLSSKSLGFGGCQEAWQLCVGDIERKTDDKGCTYYEWTEKISKTQQGNAGTRQFNPKIFSFDPDGENSDRCLVKVIDKFLSLGPKEMSSPESHFFLAN